ncbi:MAG: aminotransferase DegT [Rhodospirillales bacterium]|nr:aminotransferase DegT [Rhodospirillales bacterium]
MSRAAAAMVLWPSASRTKLPRQKAVSDMAVNSVIIGGGPAGVAPLISASRDGTLEEILSGGLAVVERGSLIGAGSIGSYAINSDSTAETIVSCVLENTHPHLVRLRDHPATKAVAAYGSGAAPLALVGSFLAAVGAALHDMLSATPGSAVLLGHDAIETRQTRNGLWRTHLRRISDGAVQTILSRTVVMATGGHQSRTHLESYDVAGTPLLPRYASKLIQSNEALTTAGLEAIGQRLAGRQRKRVAIVGSSSSALACAYALLNTKYGQRFGADAVTVLHRRPLRVFYPSAAAAIAEGYDQFGPDDICPISGFVFRFAGFRLESRELVMAALGIGGRPPERRLRLHRLTTGLDPAAHAILEEADVIVAALGYRPRALPVLNASGRVVPLYAGGPGARPLVNSDCCVLDSAGDPIPGLFGIGLAAGFASPKAAGGEPSFSGQTNGLWQWQNNVGALVAERVRERARRIVANGGSRLSDLIAPPRPQLIAEASLQAIPG